MFRSVDYNAIARTYDRRYQENDYSGVENALVAFVGEDPHTRVLEVGCGTGHWLRLVADRDVHIAGLDASENMLLHARAQASGVPLVLGAGEQLPFANESLDRIFYINAFHHFRDKVWALMEATRVLRRGAHVMIVGLDPHVGVDRWYIYEYFEPVREIDRRRYPASSQIRQWMHGLQLADVCTREIQHLPVRLSARAAIEQGRLDKGVTSQLSVLTDEEYQRGIDRIRGALEAAEARGESLYLSADLRLYATRGSRPA
jgi:ubiquinone/menaquinone biosynthesis C-methylase UbiE